MHLVFALPDPDQSGNGGGTAYMDGLTQAARHLGHTIDCQTGAGPIFPPHAVPVIDGMLLPSLRPRLDELLASGAIALIHHVSAAAGRDDGAKEIVHAIEAEMLPRMRLVVATSQPVATRLTAEFGIAAKIVPPGARDLPRSTNQDPDTPLILAVGVLTRRKRHDLLLRAAARLTDLPWRLSIAGDAGREPAHAAELAALIDELGLAQRAKLIADPAPDALDHLWHSASVFALATRWEGYPASVAEALRRGIPVVVSDSSDAADIVPVAAGAVVPRDDMATFGKCLRRVLFDDDLRREMTEAAWNAGQKLPGWPERARAFIDLLES